MSEVEYVMSSKYINLIVAAQVAEHTSHLVDVFIKLPAHISVSELE